jgi:predicted transcriptional regulator
MKAIIEVSRRGAVFDVAAEQIGQARAGGTVDLRLGFESAGSLCAEITPSRLGLLDVLRRVGPCRIDELAAALTPRREGAELAVEIERLQTLGLVEQTDGATLSVPFDAIEIRLPLAQVA